MLQKYSYQSASYLINCFYIKPQPVAFHIPTSESCFINRFYIKPQPTYRDEDGNTGCFTNRFYIKPQLRFNRYENDACCFTNRFYIKPQQIDDANIKQTVALLIVSTSNRNCALCWLSGKKVALLIVSTSNRNLCSTMRLYKPLLY